MQVISEDQYLQIIDHFGEDALTVGMGAESIRGLLEELNLEEIKVLLREESQTTKSQTKRRSSPSASRSWKRSSNPATAPNG